MLPKWTNSIQVPARCRKDFYMHEYMNVLDIIPHMDSVVKQKIATDYWELITEMFESSYELIENPCVLNEGLKIIHDDFVDALLKENSYAQLVRDLLLIWSEAMRICSVYIQEYATKELR